MKIPDDGTLTELETEMVKAKSKDMFDRFYDIIKKNADLTDELQLGVTIVAITNVCEFLLERYDEIGRRDIARWLVMKWFTFHREKVSEQTLH